MAAYITIQPTKVAICAIEKGMILSGLATLQITIAPDMTRNEIMTIANRRPKEGSLPFCLMRLAILLLKRNGKPQQSPTAIATITNKSPPHKTAEVFNLR